MEIYYANPTRSKKDLPNVTNYIEEANGKGLPEGGFIGVGDSARTPSFTGTGASEEQTAQDGPRNLVKNPEGESRVEESYDFNDEKSVLMTMAEPVLGVTCPQKRPSL